MTIYRGLSGVNREVKQQYRGLSGVNRELIYQYRGYGGVNRQVFSARIGGIDANTLMCLHAEDLTTDSAYSRTITNTGVTLDSSGKFRNCLNFNGNSNFTLGMPSQLNVGSYDFTIDFWIYPTSSSKGVILAFGGKAARYYGCMYVSLDSGGGGTTLRARFANTSDSVIYEKYSNVLTLNVWNHVAIVRYGTSLKVYINGTTSSAFTATISGTLSSPASYGENAIIGWNLNENYSSFGLHAKLDEIRLSNIARWTVDFKPPAIEYST
jgi:hypothetical protein